MLTFLHLYWIFGGKWGFANTIPTNRETNTPVFKPGKLGTLIVATGLLFFACVTLCNRFNIDISLLKYLNYAISIIFLLRTIGDFKYVGLFKKVKNTPFANYDDKYFVPLCAYLAISTFIVAV